MTEPAASVRAWTLEIVVATSIDGKISTADRGPWRWSDPADHEWLLERMTAADLLVVGAGTIRAEDPSLRVPAELAARREAQGRPPQPARLILTPSLSIRPDARILREGDTAVVVAARAEAWAQRGDGIPDHVGRIEWTGNVAAALHEGARRHDARTIIGLGGGRTNAALLEADLVDRISHTISAFVIGAAGAPGPFDGEGFAPPGFRAFRLEESRNLGRDVLHVWARDPRSGPRTEGGGLG